MKKSLLNIITLVLVLTNTVLTAIMVVVVIQSMNSSNAVISKVAQAIDLEKGEAEESQLSINDTETYDPDVKLTIKLRSSKDGKEHYAVIYPQLKINKKNEDYAKLSKTLDDYKGDITQCVQDVVQQYTAEELQSDPDKVREDILAKLQEMYNSEFIIGVIFSSTTIQ